MKSARLIPTKSQRTPPFPQRNTLSLFLSPLVLPPSASLFPPPGPNSLTLSDSACSCSPIALTHSLLSLACSLSLVWGPKLSFLNKLSGRTSKSTPSLFQIHTPMDLPQLRTQPPGNSQNSGSPNDTGLINDTTSKEKCDIDRRETRTGCPRIPASPKFLQKLLEELVSSWNMFRVLCRCPFYHFISSQSLWLVEPRTPASSDNHLKEGQCLSQTQ